MPEGVGYPPFRPFGAPDSGQLSRPDVQNDYDSAGGMLQALVRQFMQGAPQTPDNMNRARMRVDSAMQGGQFPQSMQGAPSELRYDAAPMQPQVQPQAPVQQNVPQQSSAPQQSVPPVPNPQVGAPSAIENIAPGAAPTQGFGVPNSAVDDGGLDIGTLLWLISGAAVLPAHRAITDQRTGALPAPQDTARLPAPPQQIEGPRGPTEARRAQLNETIIAGGPTQSERTATPGDVPGNAGAAPARGAPRVPTREDLPPVGQQVYDELVAERQAPAQPEQARTPTPPQQTARIQQVEEALSTPATEEDASPRARTQGRVPESFRDFVEILPRDVNGNPDWELFSRVMQGNFGVNAYQQLTDAQKAQLWDMLSQHSPKASIAPSTGTGAARTLRNAVRGGL